MTAGSWKHKLLPNDVAAWTKTSLPCKAAHMMSRWKGLHRVRGAYVGTGEIESNAPEVLLSKLSTEGEFNVLK